MSKAWKLILCGLIPLAVGYALNFVLLYLPVFGLMMNTIQVGFLTLWGYLAYRLSDKGKSPFAQAFLMCAVGLVMLALVLYQELVMGQYWPNIAGIATQTYFLPLLTLASSIFTSFIELFMPVMRIWPYYIAIWICMFAAACAGCLKKQKS